MGHAVIVNNVASEFPGTTMDSALLQETFRMIGFKVTMESNCSGMVSPNFYFLNCATLELVEHPEDHLQRFSFWPDVKPVPNATAVASFFLCRKCES